MSRFTPDRYRAVEELDDEIFQKYMKEEADFLRRIPNMNAKTFVDLGAGYGRALPVVAEAARNVVSIELSPEMLVELRERAAQYPRVVVVEGNLSDLLNIIDSLDISNPVFAILQNTLGTIDEGYYGKVLEEIKKSATKHKGEVVLSLLRKESLRDWGIPLYRKIKRLSGEPDLEKTDFEKGIFVSKDGYVSKWWSDEEIKQMKEFLGGRVVDEISELQYYIMRVEGI